MIGDKIKTLREEEGISIRRLAQLISVAYSTMLCVEKNKNKPSARVLKKLSDYFNVENDFWYKNDNNVKMVNDAEQKTLNEANRLAQIEAPKKLIQRGRKPKQAKEDIYENVQPVVSNVRTQEEQPVVTKVRTREEQDEYFRKLYGKQLSIREEMISILRKEIATKEQLLIDFKNLIDDLMEELRQV